MAQFNIIYTNEYGERFQINNLPLSRPDALSLVERDYELGGLTGATFRKTSMHRWEYRKPASPVVRTVELVVAKNV